MQKKVIKAVRIHEAYRYTSLDDYEFHKRIMLSKGYLIHFETPKHLTIVYETNEIIEIAI